MKVDEVDGGTMVPTVASRVLFPADAQDVLPVTADMVIMKALQSSGGSDPFALPELLPGVLRNSVSLPAFKTVLTDLARRR